MESRRCRRCHTPCRASKHRFGRSVKAESRPCRKTYEELKAKSVEFLQPPTEGFYGVEALLKDDSGNWFSMTQRMA
jgi:hypothetical protein